MKRLNIGMSVLLGVALLTACESDRDSNPVLQVPTTFVLNTPANAANVYDLQSSKTIELTCSQPDYGYPAKVTYAVQVSLSEQFVEETETADATYQTLPSTFTSAKMEVDTKEIDKAVLKLGGWEEEKDCPTTPVSVFVRLYASVASGMNAIESNKVELKAIPYYMDISDAVPVTYYLLGNFIGDETWGSAIGVSAFPMSLVEGCVYDPNTGKGEFAYTGYFPANEGFKVVAVPGAWDDQWGNNGTAGNGDLVNDKNSQNIQVAAAGWYTLHLNTVKNTLTMEEATLDPAPTEYDAITLTYGDESVEMTKVTMEHSHVWYANITIAANCKAKFTSGDKTWGGEVFPFGLAAEGNISCKAGTYTVIFNDLDECYYFKVTE